MAPRCRSRMVPSCGFRLGNTGVAIVILEEKTSDTDEIGPIATLIKYAFATTK